MQHIFPNISAHDLQFFYHGTYNVFEVKKRLIFRFPDRHFRNAMGVSLIKKEIETLQIVKQHLRLRIPKPIYFSFDPHLPYMGYEKLKGIPLSKYFNKIDDKTKEKIAKEIASFLSDLHSLDLVKVFSNNKYSAEDYRIGWKKYFQKIQAEIFPLLQSDQQRWLMYLFNDFLDKKENFNFAPKVVHGDFDITNILYNPKTQRISGIVDFEDTRIYDPAADLLFFREGEQFLEKILEYYPYQIDTQFRNRMKFLFGRTCLPYIEFGYMNDRPEMVTVGLKMLDDRMKRFPMDL
ncbi:MAG: phosphotransferase [Candidatus Heimdallarchaeota archaeon]|nr:MAG: phosphotransferase [Candidatus Heimdallarchaeota archaeon]